MTIEPATPRQAFSLDANPGLATLSGRFVGVNFSVPNLGIGDFHVPKRFGILTFEGSPR